MIKQLSIIIVFLLFGCISQKKQPDNQKSSSFNEIEIIIEENDDNLIFKINNNSEKESIILNQNKLHIERMVNNKWEKIKLLNCPCGAPCAQQSELIEILIGKNYILKWDKKESWCGKKNKNGIPDTNTSICQPGDYRIRIVFSSSKNKSQVIYKEFNIN